MNATGRIERSLGVDFGGVVVPRFLEGSDLSGLLDGTLPPRPDALPVLAKWNRRLEGRVWLVARVDPAARRAVRAWLAHRGFEWETGIDSSRWIFVADREGKRQACEDHRIGVFVDDQKKNLEFAAAGGARGILFAPRVSDQAYDQVWNWEDLDLRLTRVFAEAEARG